jgi:hypothetical protein
MLWFVVTEATIFSILSEGFITNTRSRKQTFSKNFNGLKAFLLSESASPPIRVGAPTAVAVYWLSSILISDGWHFLPK